MARGAGLARRQARVGWAFLTPALALLLVIGIYPLAHTFYLSFTNAELGYDERDLVAFDNYLRLYRDGGFWQAVLQTLIFTVASVSLEFLLGLGIALLIHSRFPGRGAVRAAILIPWAVPTVVSAKIWNFMLVDYGVFNDLLVTRLGLLDRGPAWVAEPGLAMLSVVLVDVWKTTPFVALLLLAGLQLIPEGLYQAASVDGATRWQQFWRITLPMLKPAIAVTLIFRTLDALRVFDAIWVLTGGANNTESMATYTYRQMMSFGSLGYGSAASVTIFLLIALFVVAYVAVLRPGRSDGE